MNDQEFEPSNGNNKALIVALAILALGVAAGGWLFYSARAREHARVLREKNEREACQSHLKLLSGAWRAFADGHDGRFPFALSGQEGGTLEACQRRADGVDENALAHYLMIASNSTTTIDPRCAALPPGDWRTNESTDALYHLHTARKKAESDGVLMYCPIHNLMVTAAGNLVYIIASEDALEKDAIRAEARLAEQRAASARQAGEAEEQKKREAEEAARRAARREELEQARLLEAELNGIKETGRTWTFQTGKTRKAKFVELRGGTLYLDFAPAAKADTIPKPDIHPVAVTNLAAFDQEIARKAAGK
jgi:hypothetical protein